MVTQLTTRPPIKVGILGAGQLARLLADAAHQVGLTPLIYRGDLADDSALEAFLAGCEGVVFENEFVDCARLRGLSHDRDLFWPPLSAITTFQDKLNQKRILHDLGIPTAPYTLDLEEALDAFGGRCVVKWSRMGYDGKGVFVVDRHFKHRDQIVSEASQRGIPLYAERLVNFRREFAVIAVLSQSGEFLAYPLVVSEQESGICRRVYGPATSLGVPVEIERRVHGYAERIARAHELYGAFALELFEDQDGSVLVNEIAPRVHNSGHYTLDACDVSQFENHWRAFMGERLGLSIAQPQCRPAFVMLNALGPPGVEVNGGEAIQPDTHRPLYREDSPAGVRLHWYEKPRIVPRRKVGHWNAVGNSIGQLPFLLDALDKEEKAWIDKLKGLSEYAKKN